jgi:prepilin-type N-terminal cleavage/methylation domain-containing protein
MENGKTERRKLMKAGKAGFTLIELMVVIVIFAILMGLAIYGMNGVTSTLRYKQGEDTALGALKLARARAIRGQTEGVVVFTAGPPSTYAIFWMDRVTQPSLPRWVPEGSGQFPRDVVYLPVGAGSDTFQFQADGSAPGAPIGARIHSTSARGFTQTIQVLAATGLVSIQ